MYEELIDREAFPSIIPRKGKKGRDRMKRV